VARLVDPPLGEHGVRPHRLHAGRGAGARPRRRRALLTENYGDWRTPVTEFNCTTGTPNLVISRTFRSVALFLTRLAHFAHGDPTEYAKLRATLVADGMLRDEGGVLHLQRDV
jgi:hypothetical protein